MTPDQFALLRQVNSEVNAMVYSAIPKAGQDPARWINHPDGGTFECRDYSVAKSTELQRRGFPVGFMSIVECWIEPEPLPGQPDSKPQRQWHAVLACRDAPFGTPPHNVFILDNRTTDIYDWRSPPYPYIWGREQIAGTLEFRDASQGLV
jgi:predicted transglutaminase-like cysteine proteinase